MSSSRFAEDPIHAFLMEAHSITVDAQFIVDSLPNADLAAVERSAHQLGAVRKIVEVIDDDSVTDTVRQELLADSLETYRQIFDHLETNGLLDMDNIVHSTCLYLVFVSRIQASLDRTRDAWNHHKIRTEQSRTPIAMYELSREAAIRRGYWTGDPGDDGVVIDELYGFDGHAAAPAEPRDEPLERMEQPTNVPEERTTGILLNTDEELFAARDLLPGFDWARDDGNWGIDVYCEAVVLMNSVLAASKSV
ncbi:hypothetical protein FB45DRAFT_843087 [Roridomyces roridus]|uniref:Integrase core domain-containing protein n=1 Tax=Roridomyces roridus TaxID=1738132 RepID=A0AAD7FD71_9AGAR|nr:hypothetical protein FB45DRAFT_843173 [Roridomyces roridus]KAJ7613192.1 hypothetical protein FB45DRAFT_843087 [Roridomyces roridus]